MNNWYIHKSKSTINYLKKIKFQVMFFPAYSPILAPIEEFYGILKLKLRKQWTNIEVKLNHKENYSKILKALKEIKSETIKKLYRRLFSTVKELIG